MNTKELHEELRNSKLSERMPVVFVGHGNPMNAITDNEYRITWCELGSRLVRPSAVLCISAHWLTKGTFVSVTDKPQTIHDFYGFPDELFKVNYPVSGARNYAEETISKVTWLKY
ncbi:MAG: class III extradiol ring-cleavage dioxygenase [Ignavibacteria bacterium]